MKKYNIENYVRYKNELLDKINKNKKYLVKDSNGNTMYHLLTPEQTIIQFMPLVENIARKFSTSQQASGVMSINDLIQEGNAGLVRAVS